MYSPLNSYVYIHWILDFKYILLLFCGDFPSDALIVIHSLEGYVLWSSVSTNCLQVFLRCSFVVLVTSSLICCRAGEVGSLDLRSSRAHKQMIRGMKVTSCAGACRGYVDVGSDDQSE